jgi:hypothetical protein
MSNAGKIRVPVVDKNGKETHVWKSPDELKGEASRSSVIPTAPAPSADTRQPNPSSDDFVTSVDTVSVESPFGPDANWSYKVDLGDILTADTSLAEKAELLSDAISDSDWYADTLAAAEGGSSELVDAVEDLREVSEDGSAAEFDVAWNNIYNIADNDKVYLGQEVD